MIRSLLNVLLLCCCVTLLGRYAAAQHGALVSASATGDVAPGGFMNNDIKKCKYSLLRLQIVIIDNRMMQD